MEDNDFREEIISRLQMISDPSLIRTLLCAKQRLRDVQSVEQLSEVSRMFDPSEYSSITVQQQCQQMAKLLERVNSEQALRQFVETFSVNIPRIRLQTAGLQKSESCS